MALVFVFIRPQFVDYWFLISCLQGFSATEFIIIIFINDVVTNWISVAMNVTLINMFFYCTSSKIAFLQWCMASTDPPSIIFVGFFHEKCLLAIY